LAGTIASAIYCNGASGKVALGKVVAGKAGKVEIGAKGAKGAETKEEK
jgi:hypothetical protein